MQRNISPFKIPFGDSDTVESLPYVRISIVVTYPLFQNLPTEKIGYGK